MTSLEKFDVVISGGGLAGLALALQVINANANIKIAIIEKNSFPIPKTTAKVGESTVEIGSHYLSKVLGLKEHLEQKHLRKFGLRCFFGAPQGDFSEQDELGVSQLFNAPSYQIERGTLENHLYQLVKSKGVKVFDGAKTSKVEIEPHNHKIWFEKDGKQLQATGRWIVDAAGRAGLVKKQLNLHVPAEHQGNAVYFRINRRIVLDDWSNSNSWHERIYQTKKRWLSTNHLMGPGYWVWVIPLESGATSIGVVFDQKLRKEVDFSSFDKCFSWLLQNQPLCAQKIEGAEVLDFHQVVDYSFKCKRFFSSDGWAVTGEAGAFIDPFYSPGSDFIAISNSFIADLILEHIAGNEIRIKAPVYHSFFNYFVEHTQSLYLDQYGGFGDRQLMAMKLVWDYSYYWGVIAVMFVKGAMTDIQCLKTLNPILQKANRINNEMQAQFRERAQKRLQLPVNGNFFDQYKIPCLLQFTQALSEDCKLGIEQALTENINKMEVIAQAFSEVLAGNTNREISTLEQSVLGDYRLSVIC